MEKERDKTMKETWRGRESKRTESRDKIVKEMGRSIAKRDGLGKEMKRTRKIDVLPSLTLIE